MTFRFGAVSYLNAKPLIEGLVPLVRETPARLAERMAAGGLDVALLPVIGGARLGLPRIGALGVAAEGPVDSVLLFVRRRPIRTLRLDPASRTSQVLAQIILREAMGVVPELVESDADVELVIGDPALDRAEQGDEETIDLAAEWTRWSGLPFVFAAWYGDAAAEPELAAAYARGREKLAEYASGTRLTYLRERIRYEIGPREEEGLARFLELARHHSLL